jgi:hypothetical protein
MTTFTTQDREALEKCLDFYEELKREDVSIEIEPIPFMGMVKLQDMDDKEYMLREQIRIQQNEIGRLKAKLMENGIND